MSKNLLLTDATCDVTNTLARVLGGVLSVDDAAALLGESEAAVRTRFSDETTAVAATREAIRMRLGGELVEVRAQGLMPSYLDRLESLLNDPDTSASVIVEVGRELGALSGSKTRSEARAKRQVGAPLTDGPLVIIQFADGRTTMVGTNDGHVIEHGELP